MHAKKALVCLIVTCLSAFGGCQTIEDYCRVNILTTPCLTKCTRAKKCGVTRDVLMPLTPDEREEILNEHNFYREGVASGNYSAHHLNACAGGIKALSYSLELEFLAACWINQCSFEHDKVRLNARGEKVGQNLHQVYSSHEVGWKPTFATNGVGRWFKEYALLSDDAQVQSHGSVKGVGHLTAMVWGDTKLVGCAKMHFMQPRRDNPQQLDHAYNLYCNYWPAGNWRGAAVYKNKTCDKANSEWPHLCGEIRPMEADTFEMPAMGGADVDKEDAKGRSGKKKFSSVFMAPLFFIHSAVNNVL